MKIKNGTTNKKMRKCNAEKVHLLKMCKVKEIIERNIMPYSKMFKK